MRRASQLVVIAALATVGPRPLEARRFIMEPSIPSACPGGRSWDKVHACLKRHGIVRVWKKDAKVRLVQVAADANKSRGFRIPGVYLYTQVGAQWRLGGMLLGDDYRLVQFGKVRGIRTEMFRIDVTTSHTDVINIGQQMRRAHVRQTIAVFCNGREPLCSSTLTSCDVYVEGKSYFMFRGKLDVVDDRVANVTGDRTKTGDHCISEPQLFLPRLFDAADPI